MGLLVRFAARSALSLAVVLAPPAALAGPAPPEATTKGDKGRVKSLFFAAEAAMQAGRWVDALARLDELLPLREASSVRYYRGICNARLERWVEAHHDFERAVSFAWGSSTDDDKYIYTQSMKALRDTERHTAEIAVVAGPVGDDERPTLTIDGAPLGAEAAPHRGADSFLWGPVRLVRGEHVVEVSLAGREPLRRTIAFAELKGDEANKIELIELAWPGVVMPRSSSLSSLSSPSLPSSPPKRVAGAREPALLAPVIAGSVAATCALGSIGLFTVHLVQGRNGAGEQPYLAPALVAGGGALAAGVLAWALAGASSPMATAASSAPARRGGGVVASSRLVVVPNAHGASLVWGAALW
jgi:hypothetical protein